MGAVSGKGKIIFYVGIAVIVVLAVVWFFTMMTGQQENTIPVSRDEFSLSLAERWGGGVPEGYRAKIVDSIGEDGEGYLFAKLTYEENIGESLSQWREDDSAVRLAMDSVIDEHLATQLSEEDRQTIEQNRPASKDGWLYYSILSGNRSDGSVLYLSYDPQTCEMYVVERQVAEQQ